MNRRQILMQRIEALMDPDSRRGLTRYFVNPDPRNPASKPVLYKITRSNHRPYDLDVCCVSREHADQDIIINNEVYDN
mgnify:CR=1 FL=1